LGFFLISSIYGQELSDEQKALVREVVSLSDKELQNKKLTWIDAATYKEHPYWKAVFRLGKQVTPQQSKQFAKIESRTLEQALLFNAAACVADRERLDALVDRYRSDYYSIPRRNGMRYRKLKPEHVTAEDRPLWELLLLSPQVGKIGVKRCLEALEKCADLSTLATLRQAKTRLIMGGAMSKKLLNDIRSEGRLAASTIVNWLRMIEHIDSGGKSGLGELLFALEFVEKEYPQLNSLERFKDSPYYDSGSKGVSRYLFDDAFVRKTDKGEWIWRDAFRQIETEGLSERLTEVVEMMRKQF